jgi:hypothetical protein
MRHPIDSSTARLLIALGLLACSAPAALAQRPTRAPAADQAQDQPLPPLEVQRLFDAYVTMQAQEALKLTDEQLPQFIVRLRSIQEVHRRHFQARNRIVQQLAQLAAQENLADEARIREALKALQDLDTRSDTDLRASYAAVDQLLDLRQQARLRVFLDQMERRKLDLLARARRGAAIRRGAIK